MLFFILFLMCIFAVLGIGALAAISDFRGMTIPNLYSILIFAAFFLCYGSLWLGGYADAVFASFSSHVIGFVVVFAASFALFSFGVWGGGDQKLLSAFAVWMGLGGLPAFLIYTTLFGGVLGIAALILKKFKPIANPAAQSWVAQVQDGASKVPYGIAISVAALASFVKIGYLGVDTFRIFF